MKQQVFIFNSVLTVTTNSLETITTT